MDLPGFEIQREIGRGGMARVYLAVQKKFGRLVALKVVTENFARDPEFRRRFVQESRINARLTHSNIVQVYDVGAAGEALYLVMEYVAGGDLNTHLDQGMRVDDLIRVVREIGRALDYAHSRGFVHRDIKPENILFREDGTAVLSDFGIARVVDNTPSVSRTGTVMGTPQYMSPEQAAGRPLDGRSDVYSLGVVFYRMLTGDVPFQADTEVSTGIKHLQDPIPRLPNYLAAFQDVVDRALAKRPEARFQNGAEFSDALEAVKARPDLPNTTIRSQVVTTQEIRAVGAQLITSRDPGRAERHTRRRQRRTARTVLSVTLLIAVIGGASAVLIQQPGWVTRLSAAAGIIDDPMVQEAWNSARSLREDANQSLATVVAGYRRVLNLDPDHEGARLALTTIASQWKTDVEAALAQGNLVQAETKLQESMLAFPNDESLEGLAEQLTNRKHAERLLVSTQGLLRSHGLSDIPSATAAIQAYQEVLRLAPAHAVARAELDSLSQHYVTLAAQAVDDGLVDQAISYLDRASAANDRLPGLATVREKIQQANTAKSAISDMLAQASRYRAAGALINPPGENAAELYHRVLATDPDNAIATQGLNEVVSQLLSTATTLLASGDLTSMRALIDRASAVGLDQNSVNQLKSRLDGEVTRLASVDEKLDEAQALLQRGFITEPQGRNAVALLREVERLDPGNPRAADLLARSAARLANAAQEAYEVGLTSDAKHYLELALTVAPNVPAWRNLRNQWEEDGATL
ncbi:MAG: protein kinase [Roseibium album]|uniref:serine/threonine-protein kinase n=1 Tax=Roseibium album TaxID=311410 RepID=UPI0032EF6672